MKKFDLTGAFLITDIDTVMHIQIPGYELPKDKALLLKKALDHQLWQELTAEPRFVKIR